MHIYLHKENIWARYFSLPYPDPGSPDVSPLPPGVTSKEMMAAMEDIWLDNADLDNEPISPLTEQKQFVRDDPRRHSIGVCQSQRRSVMKKSKSTTPTVSYFLWGFRYFTYEKFEICILWNLV